MMEFQLQQQRENQDRTREIEQLKERAHEHDTTAQKEEDKEETDKVEKGKRGPGAL